LNPGEGMEFPVVYILDGGWKHPDIEEERRLFYVGMTRAKTQLFLCRVNALDNPHILSLKAMRFTNALLALKQGQGSVCRNRETGFIS